VLDDDVVGTPDGRHQKQKRVDRSEVQSRHDRRIADCRLLIGDWKSNPSISNRQFSY
jgi:hypothetical protein